MITTPEERADEAWYVLTFTTNTLGMWSWWSQNPMGLSLFSGHSYPDLPAAMQACWSAYQAAHLKPVPAEALPTRPPTTTKPRRGKPRTPA